MGGSISNENTRTNITISKELKGFIETTENPDTAHIQKTNS